MLLPEHRLTLPIHSVEILSDVEVIDQRILTSLQGIRFRSNFFGESFRSFDVTIMS